MANARQQLRIHLEKECRRLADVLAKQVRSGVGFTLLLFDFGEDGNISYVSTAARKEMMQAFRELLVNLEEDGAPGGIAEEVKQLRETAKALETEDRGLVREALARHLRARNADEVIAHWEREPITAAEMLGMLDRNDPPAVEFVADVAGAALRTLRVERKVANETIPFPDVLPLLRAVRKSMWKGSSWEHLSDALVAKLTPEQRAEVESMPTEKTT